MVKAFFARDASRAGVSGHGAAEGQGLVEYALILVLISVAAIGVLGALGVRINEVFATILTGLGGGSN